MCVGLYFLVVGVFCFKANVHDQFKIELRWPAETSAEKRTVNASPLDFSCQRLDELSSEHACTPFLSNPKNKVCTPGWLWYREHHGVWCDTIQFYSLYCHFFSGTSPLLTQFFTVFFLSIFTFLSRICWRGLLVLLH